MKKFILFWILVVLLVGCSPSVNPDPDDNMIEEPVEEPKEEPKQEIVFRNVFSGAVIASEDPVKAVAVMIENSGAARPQSGIGVADIVYEISVDGWSVSRFLAIFQSQFPSKVGPNRSARIPFVQIASEWMLPFAHYGAAQTGLGNAYELIRNIRWPIRFDGVSGLNDDFYSRDLSRSAPHNAFFDAQEASEKISEIVYERRFAFDEQPTDSETVATMIRLDYSSLNKVRYEFDSLTRKYMRFINDKPMMDAYTDSQVSVTNVILLYAPHWDVESYKYVLVDFSQSGKAEYFIQGKFIAGRWEKNKTSGITQYFDAQGNEVVLFPGNTWVQVVSDHVKIAYE